MQKLDFTDVNKYFNAPLTKSSSRSSISDNERWAQEYYGRIQHHHGRSSSSVSSSSSSSITLTNDEEQLVAAFKSLKYAWDDPVPDHLAQKGWSQIQAHLASSSPPSGYLPPPRPPAGGVNPHAPPFVPSQQRQPHMPRPSHRHSSSFSSSPSHRSSSPKPGWYDSFSNGTSTYSSDEHAALAAELVSYRPWTPEALAELARRFCIKGTKAMALGSATPRGTAIIEFLKAVVDELTRECGDWYAGSFKWHLGECAIGTFKSCYQSVSFPVLLRTIHISQL
jgi:hypothetical protein